MHLIFWVIFVMMSHFTGTDQTVLRTSFKSGRNLNSWSNEIHFTWIVYPPWKHRNDIFNAKLYNNSVEYFSINEGDHITNESYIETSKLTVCNEVNLTFSSKVNNSHENINLILFLYKQNVWNKKWEYIHNHSQWQLHELTINITDKKEDIQFRFIPISNSSHQISIAIAILNITTHTNCRNLNSINQSQHRGKNLLIHPFLFVIFGSTFFLIFLTVMIIFISKQYNQWYNKRFNRRRKKGPKSRNIIGDEPTILSVETNIV